MNASTSVTAPESSRLQERPTTRTSSRRVGTGILGQLNREWAALTVRTHEPLVAAWVRSHPVLSPARTLDEVPGLVERRRGNNDREVAALIALARAGDAIAAQTLMHVLIGPACRLAARTRAYADDLESARCQAIGALWTAVQTYNLPRRSHHITGLTLDALRLITRRPRTVEEIPVDGTQLTEVSADVSEPLDLRSRFWMRRTVDADRAGEHELDLLLDWAIADDVLPADTAALVRRLNGRTRVTSADVARELGISPSAVRERQRQALRRLAVSVRHTATGQPPATLATA